LSRHLDPHDQDGLTLVELLVTLSVLAALLGSVATGMITMTRSVADTQQRLDDLGQARVAMDAASRSLRTAVRIPGATSPFTVTAVGDVEFYANVGATVATGPSLVRLFLDAQSRLIEQTTPPTPSAGSFTYNPAQQRTRVLARGIADPALFTYRCAAAPCAPGFNAAAITAVDLAIQVRSVPGGDVAASALRTTVRVVNAVPPVPGPTPGPTP
jgi:prepilin-type N-terminal cleavage/methylation domain-containing protein